MDRLSPLVTLAAIEQQAGDLLMLHAGAVADATTGRALVFVGPSGAGKTTATQILARRWGYLSDETVGIRPDGAIVVYPKPLSVKVDGSPYKEQRSPDDVGLAATLTTARAHRFVLLARDDSDEPWVEEVPVVRALALLAPETSYLSRIEQPLHRLAAALGPAGLRTLHYREAEQLPSLVEQILGED
jgi:energy-coupling factor transporter ATP-binding protein EcfA2